MSFVVDWDGRQFDIDPNEFTGLELAEIKIRTTWSYRELIRELGGMDSEAFRVLFWTVDKRDNQELKFSEYAGPPPRVYVPHYKAFIDEVTGLLGKAVPKEETPTTETTGGQPSSSNSDGSHPMTIEL
jgi:hypothetical protein